MSPQRVLKRVTQDPLARLIAYVGGLLAIVGSVAASARYVHVAANNIETRSHAESVFVKIDNFALYQQGETMRRDAQYTALLTFIARMDTSLKVCIQHRDTCK